MMDCPICGYPNGAYVTHICDGIQHNSTGDALLGPIIALHFDYDFKAPCIELREQSAEDMATVRRMQARQAEAAQHE